jgi:hypothetical protein
MTFEEILAHVLDLLQRQGRVSYQALRLRFNLDDAYIEGLKDELIYAQQVAIDEDGGVLVWTGKAATTPGSVAPSPTPHGPAEAERRQLTVLFCDLVDSTTLAGTDRKNKGSFSPRAAAASPQPPARRPRAARRDTMLGAKAPG